MTGSNTTALRTWATTQVQSGIQDAFKDSTSIVPQDVSILSEIAAINQKLGSIMATVADLQAILASNEASEGKLITLLNSLSTSNAALTKQLSDAVAAGGDSAAIQAVIAQMQTDQQVMDAAISAFAVAPSKPVIS